MKPHLPIVDAGRRRGPTRRPLRIALVTETYPPEVNGVALTVARVVEGLRQRGHDAAAGAAAPGRRRRRRRAAAATAKCWCAALPIPRYPHLRMGLPAGRALAQAVAQPPAGRGAHRHRRAAGLVGAAAARELELPVTSDFRTNFHAYSRPLRHGLAARPIMAYLRQLPQPHAAARWCRPRRCARELQAAGFERTRGRRARRRHAAVRPGAAQRGAARAAGASAEDDAGRAVRRPPGAGEEPGRCCCRPSRRCAASTRARAWCWWATARCAPRCSSAVPRRVFAGQRSGDDLAAHYASADLFLFPSLTETFGNVTPEAMASGLPVLAFDHAAAGQLIEHGQNGWLAPAGRRRGLRAAGAAAGAASRPRRAAQRRGGTAQRPGAGLGRHRAPGRDRVHLGADRAPQPGPASSLLARWGPT